MTSAEVPASIRRRTRTALLAVNSTVAVSGVFAFGIVTSVGPLVICKGAGAGAGESLLLPHAASPSRIAIAQMNCREFIGIDVEFPGCTCIPDSAASGFACGPVGTAGVDRYGDG